MVYLGTALGLYARLGRKPAKPGTAAAVAGNGLAYGAEQTGDPSV